MRKLRILVLMDDGLIPPQTLEGLSDAVFGFAITLLIVSLEVPKTSSELIATMRGFVAFAFTFFILFTIWYRQFSFFRRYGLEDKVAIALNGALLFVVLFFIYPLKFLATWTVGRLMGGGKSIVLANGELENSTGPVRYTGDALGIVIVLGIVMLMRLRMRGRRQRHAMESLAS